jgi:hypothetical protein
VQLCGELGKGMDMDYYPKSHVFLVDLHPLIGLVSRVHSSSSLFVESSRYPPAFALNIIAIDTQKLAWCSWPYVLGDHEKGEALAQFKARF